LPPARRAFVVRESCRQRPGSAASEGSGIAPLILVVRTFLCGAEGEGVVDRDGSIGVLFAL
jgi:hypothetical protein